jgi:adenylate cyclase
MRLLWSGTPLERLRLWSGLVLFAFVATHLINHAVGLWSLEAMTRVQHWRLVVTRSPPGFVLLTAALLAHMALALWKLARLRTLRLRGAEILQGLSGLLIPFLLMPHLFEAGVGPRSLGLAAAYPAILPLLWPAKAVHQVILVAVVWLHGCLGLHYWLRGESWYRAASHVLAALAALVPAAALAGFVVAGREAARLAAASTDRPAIEAAAGLSRATREAMGTQSADATLAFYGLVALTIAVLALRLYVVRRPAEFSIVYAGGPTVRSAAGPTLLEISRAHRVPHLSVCGGKARCSTCRVRIVERGEALAEPSEAEQRLLRRIDAPPDVRLACQIRPNGPLMVALLLRPAARFIAPTPASGFEAAGVDREAAVLFVDIRGFTRLSQAKLAYDIVHILNSFFAAVGQAIEAAGGRVDKYIGDGLMAVFEHPTGLPGASRAAVEAVIAVDAELAGVNRQLADEIAEPLRIAMGLHGGRLVIGRIGWGAAALPTVIGPAVNIASRLESLAKSRNVALAISRQCAVAAGISLEGCGVDEVDIRGLEAPFPVLLVEQVRELASARARAAVEPGEIRA